MSTRTYSYEIKERFIKAVGSLVKENYPDLKEGEIAKVVGLTPAAFSRMRKSKTNYPTLDNCALLCQAYKISAEWLINGKGNFRVPDKKSPALIDLLNEAVRMVENNPKR